MNYIYELSIPNICELSMPTYILDEIKNDECLNTFFYSKDGNTMRVIIIRDIIISGVREYKKIIYNNVTIEKSIFYVNLHCDFIIRNQEIKRLYKDEKLTQHELAKIFNLSQSRIHDILKN
ncbi:MAG: sigma factor-like helix-turn-helix DNA-binding protein [Cetobacterium sp.]|uniref:sigma factor-like helix-turn-helix DNA-binding protein n=1 Tax=Cetobacterium sp. TaxID=2071632 RepID=UPI003F38239E